MLIQKALATSLIVAVPEASDPPYVLYGHQDTPGIYLDLLAEITELTGIKFSYKKAPPVRRKVMFERGEVDIEIGINPKWRSSSVVKGLYTEPFLNLKEHVYSRQLESRQSFFSNPTIGLVRGYSYPEIDSELATDRLLRVNFLSEPLLVKALAHKRVPRIVVKEDIIKWLVNNDLKNKLKLGESVFQGRLIGETAVSLRVHPSKVIEYRAIDDAIEELKNSGKLDNLIDTYRALSLPNAPQSE